MLHLEASVSPSYCAKKGFLKTGKLVGQMSVKASCVPSFDRLGTKIQVGSPAKGAWCHPQPWLRPSRGTNVTLGPSLQER